VVSAERLAIARLVHRIRFGPKPGQFGKMLKQGFRAVQRCKTGTILKHEFVVA
jgi:hypothetical protein